MNPSRVGLILTLSASIVAACSTVYDGRRDETPPADAGAEDALADAATEQDASDAAAPGRCTAHRPPGCDPAACEKRTLYASAGGYPFSIVSDATNVFWVEQRAPGDPYNGAGLARILRTTRAGSADDSKAEILAIDQPRATALALAPPYLYWTTYEAADAESYGHIKRVGTSCAAPCVPEDVTGGNPLKGNPFRQIVPDGDALLLVEASGVVFRWVPGLGAAEIGTLGPFGSLVATNDGTLGAGPQKSSVVRIAPGGASLAEAFTIPPLDGGAAGLAWLATDCTTLFGVREPTATLYRGNLGETVVVPMTPVGSGVAAIAFFDLAADAKWVYGAGANAGGLIVLEPASGLGLNVAPGNVFAIAVDDQGVYWGEHGGAGTLRMMVK
jgi:hypothetical protein